VRIIIGMTADAIGQAKEDLDRELASADPNAGIAFSQYLFDEFVARKWIRKESFTVLGLPAKIFGGWSLDAYGSHYAFVLPSLPDAARFQIGGRARS
jgi:hypothetical protein